jgi:hypothetical protein
MRRVETLSKKEPFYLHSFAGGKRASDLGMRSPKTDTLKIAQSYTQTLPMLSATSLPGLFDPLEGAAVRRVPRRTGCHRLR